jgi:NAD(P)-dependent dehydrogenase (short-subunit alcohol dehydrogenase family)
MDRLTVSYIMLGTYHGLTDGSIGSSKQVKTTDGLGSIFTVNTLAPYILTCLMDKPKSLMYLSSGMHYSGSGNMDFEKVTQKTGYSDSKLHDIMLADWFSRKLDIQSVSMDPGWVKTNLAGSGAPGTTDAPAKMMADFVDGKYKKKSMYLAPRGESQPQQVGLDQKKQDELVKICEEVSGVSV